MENGYLKVVSYNVQCLSYGKEKEKILRILKELDADIVGLQELDINTKRSGEGNQLQQIAEELGYKNHSAVIKRIKKLRERWIEFDREYESNT